MNLYSFIQENKDTEGILGDLCYDISRDEEYPAKRSDMDQVNYLLRKMAWHGHIAESIAELLTSYSFKEKQNEHGKKEKYKLELPDGFQVDEVIVVGSEQDYYKVYLLDLVNEKLIAIDLKVQYGKKNKIRASNLNKARLYNYYPEQYYTPIEASKILKSCKYSVGIKPIKETFEAVLRFLE